MKNNEFRHCVLHHAAPIHNRDIIGHGTHHPEIVCDKNVGQTELALQPLQQQKNARLHRHVERRRGFVKNKHVGMSSERASNYYPLALAAR